MFWSKKKSDSEEKPVFALERFKEAQEHDFKSALDEIKSGHKDGHWIWYIFPQVKGLGYSEYSWVYGLDGIEEAKAYLEDKELHHNLITITEALLSVQTSDIRTIMTHPDDLKVRSSMTLFYYASNDYDKGLFKSVIDKYFDGEFDKLTEKVLFNGVSVYEIHNKA